TLLAQTSSAMLIDSSAPETNRGQLCGAALLQREWAVARNGSVESALLEGLEQHTAEALDVANQPLYERGLRRNLRPLRIPAPGPADKQAAERVRLPSWQR